MRQNRTGRKSFLVLLSLLLVFMSVPLSVAADSSGGSTSGTVVWSLDTDRLGIPGLTASGEYLESEDGAYQPGVQLADQSSSYMQMYEGGALGIHATSDMYKAINIQTGEAVGGTAYYWIKGQGFEAIADTTYTVTFSVYVADGSGQVRVRGNAKTNETWETIAIDETPKSVSYTWTQASDGGNLQIDTGNTVTGKIVYIKDLQIIADKAPESKEVWSLDADRLGVPGLTANEEYLEGESGGYQPGVQLADQSSSHMQMYAGGALGIKATTGQYKAINIQTGSAVGGTDYYWNQGFRAAADTTYKVSFNAFVENGTGEVRVRGNAKTNETWEATAIDETPKSVSYTWTQASDGGNLQIDTGSTATDVIVFITDLVITQESATPTPPITGEVVLAYNLQWDVDLPNFASNGWSRYLQKAGPAINVIGTSDGSVYLDLPGRTENWHGVDVMSFAIGLRTGAEYTIEVKGRVPDEVEIPPGAQIVLGGATDPYAQLQSVDADRTFTLTYSGVAADNTGESRGLRIQADAAVHRFIIDSIMVEVQGGNEMPFGIPDIGEPDDYVWPDPAWDLSLPSLKEAYKKYFYIGNIIEPGQSDDPMLTAMFRKQYNVVTAENAMKPDALMGSMTSASDLSDPSKYTFAAADKIVKWAEDNDQFIHGHALVWHSQTPSFINQGASASRDAARANMETYVTEIVKHFDSPNLISWDVVNEAFADDTSQFDGSDWRTGLRKNSPWYIAYENGADKDKGESGADYIYDAFVFARLAQSQIDGPASEAQLYYNDYNETYKYEQIAQMVEDLNAKWEQDPRYDGRKLIEGIGMQSHFWVGQAPEVNEHEVVAVIERFIETGARISVSELDIPFANNRGFHLDDAKQALQAEKYATLFKIYKRYADHIDRVSFWGNADSMSWRSAGMPLLFDNSYRPKKAFYTVLNLGDRRSTGPVTPVETGTPGEIKVEVTPEDVAKALAEAADGVMRLQLQGTEDAEQIQVSIPVDQVQAAREEGVNHIEISSGLATVQLPVSLFADAAEGANIELNIEKVDNSTLSEEQQALVGSNTVFDFTLNVGDQRISDFGQGQSVRVAVPYTLNPGENPSQIVIYYLSDDGNLEVIKNGRYDQATGMVVFNAKHFSKYAAIANPVTFDDVANVEWAKESIEGLAARSIVSGMTKDTFVPAKPVTRAEFIQMLILALDLDQPNAASTFSDVKPGAWYYNAVASAEQLGITAGLPDGTFGTNSLITRQEMAAMAYRAIQKAGIALTGEQTAEQFRDAQDIAGYAREAVTAMHQAGIISGVGNGNFNPAGTATRAEAAVILYRLLLQSL